MAGVQNYGRCPELWQVSRTMAGVPEHSYILLEFNVLYIYCILYPVLYTACTLYSLLHCTVHHCALYTALYTTVVGTVHMLYVFSVPLFVHMLIMCMLCHPHLTRSVDGRVRRYDIRFGKIYTDTVGGESEVVKGRFALLSLPVC